jgi:hypothetical protein
VKKKKKPKDFNIHFSKEGMQMANKYMKKCSTAVTSMEIQIKTTPVGITILKRTKVKYWGGCVKN